MRSTDGNRKRAHLFFDANGDGHTDYLHLTKLSTKGRLSTYLANNDGRTPRQVTAITNGLGAVTEIDYETLSRTDHYERLGLGGSATTAQFCYTFMGASGCHPYTRTTVNQANINAFYADLNGGWNLPSGAQTLGKAGPVLEFTGPVPVVTRVDSSAPKAGSAPGAVDANATSAIEYFYAEAKVQAMGRGLLGFQQLKTKDMQTAVETTTTYRQDFPFTGMPVSTKVELPVTVNVPAEGDRPATTKVERRLLSESATTWKLKGYLATWAQTAQTSGTAAVDAFQPYAAQVVERTYDLNGGANTAPTLLATVTTDSEYDDHGNATSVTVTTAGGGTFRTRTANTYGPTEADRRNGRLTSTVVTTARDLNGDGALGASEQVTRRSDFNYYGQTPGACPVTSAAHAGMLCQEIVEPTHERLKVTTTHRYDAFGNRTRSKVDYFDDTPAPGGAAVTGTARIKTRCGAAAAATAYDARGRFVQTTADCLGRRLTEVTGRNAHGSPTGVKRYLNAARTGFVADAFAHTARGVEYLRKSGTGAHALTTRRQGAHAQCPANEAAGAMGRKAKVRTAFHERVRTGGGGETVRCYDKLAREVRTAAKGFDGTWIHRDTEYDALGRVRRASEPHYAGQANCRAGGGGQSRCWTATEHDILSRVTRIELPDGSAARTSYARYVTTHTNALSQTRTEERNALGETVRTTDHEGGVVRFTHDVQGNVTAVAREKPTADTTAAPASVTTTMAYDLFGRMTGMADPDKGASSHRRNALGELTCRQGAAGHFTVMAYDGLGRMASRKDYRAHAGAGCSMLTGAQAGSLEADAAWTHDTAANGLGLLAEVTDSKSGYRKVHAYDAFGRPDTAATTPGTGNGTHYEKTTYDQHGRVFQAFDASRTSSAFTDHGVRRAYNANGHLQALRDAVGVEDAQGSFTPRTTYRTVTAVDARGNVTAERLGNGVARSRAFDGRTGRLRTLRAGLATAADRQDRTYDWDVLGNLTRRQWTLDGTARSEAFTYDGLNRLETHQVAGGALNSVAYDGYGNIRSRTGAGTYAYGADASPAAAGPHAATSVTRPGTDGATVTYAYDANGNNTSSSDGRTIAYTAFDKPRSIAKGSHTTTFAYGPDRSRFKRTDAVTVGEGADAVTRTTTTLYLGGVERITRPDGTVQVRRRIGGVAIETANSNGGCAAGGGALHYVLRDHLGSVDALLDGAGGAVQGMAFGPWGARRQPGTGNGLTEAQRTGFDACRTTRGFTGHEMVDALGVVHMNGRIYDPALARFLQADPVVQFPADLQSWNRYSYVMNNPLAFTDPTGHFIGPLAAFAARTLVAHLAHRHLFSQVPLLGAATGIYVCSQSIVGCVDFAAHSAYAQTGSLGAALRAGAVQGISAAAFSAVGSGPLGYAPGDGAGQLLLNAVANGLVGGVMHELQGGRFGHGFLASGASALAKPAIHAAFGTGAAGKPYRIAARAAIGGTLSSATGGKFVNGAVTAAFAQAYNDERELARIEQEKERLSRAIKAAYSRSMKVSRAINDTDRSSLTRDPERMNLRVGTVIRQAKDGSFEFDQPDTNIHRFTEYVPSGFMGALDHIGEASAIVIVFPRFATLAEIRHYAPVFQDLSKYIGGGPVVVGLSARNREKFEFRHGHEPLQLR